MKAIQLKAPREFERIDVAPPNVPNSGQAIVRSHVMGICGTDMSCYLGKFPFFDYPRIPGHELGVEVIAVADDVTNVKIGDRCSVEPYLHCGECYACKKGATNCCQNLKVVGVMTNGGLCDRFSLPATKLHPSSELNYQQLSLVETLAIGYHATQRSAPDEKDQVLIVGAGPIGLATLEFTRLTGAEVTLMDLSDKRLKFCSDNYDVAHTIKMTDQTSALKEAHSITDGNGFQVVTDATGNNHSMAGALQFVAPTGSLVYVGITTSEVTFAHPVMHRPEMTILSSRNALPADFKDIINLIESGKVNTNPWVTHQIDFDDVPDQFPSILEPDSGVVKAIINIQ